MVNRAARRRAERTGAKRPVAPPVGPVETQAGPGAPQGAPGITVNISDLLQKIGALTVEVDFWKNRTSQVEDEIRQVLTLMKDEVQNPGTVEEAPEITHLERDPAGGAPTGAAPGTTTESETPPPPNNASLTQEEIEQTHDAILEEESEPEAEAIPFIGPQIEPQERAEVEEEPQSTVDLEVENQPSLEEQPAQ